MTPSIWQLLIVLVIVLLLFGRGKIPQLMGDMAKGIKSFKDLPKNAQDYIKGLEKFIETKVASISTSPERKDTILIENPFSI